MAVTAAATTQPPTFYACLKGGELSKVSTVSHGCKPGQKAVNWDSVGPQGIRGIQGIQGTQGPRGVTGAQGKQGPGAQSVVAPVYNDMTGWHANPTIVLTAGDWIILDAATGGANFGCDLSASPNVTVIADGMNEPTALGLVSVGTGGATLSLACAGNSASGLGVIVTATPDTAQ